MFKRRDKLSLLSRTGNMIWPRAGVKRSLIYVWHRVARISGSAHFITIGVISGVFASWTPFVGFHFILAALIAYFLRGSLLASALGTFFGNPFSFPFIWLSTYNLGGFLLGYEAQSEIHLVVPKGTFLLLFTNPAAFFDVMWGVVGPYFVPMLIGSFPLGIATCIPIYFVMRPIIEKYQTKRRARLAARAKSHKSTNRSLQS
jgi:uncharacterized protein (DUF2062 family)